MHPAVADSDDVRHVRRAAKRRTVPASAQASATSSTPLRRRSMSVPRWPLGWSPPDTPNSAKPNTGRTEPGRYFTVRAGSLVAWNSDGPDGPFRIVGAHTDSPNLRVKQHPDRLIAGWRVVALEPYGGAWLNSWLDRDLGISGRLCEGGAGRRRHRSPARPDRRSDPAGAAAGHPSGRGSQVADAGPAATRQRGMGCWRRSGIIRRLRRRARRGGGGRRAGRRPDDSRSDSVDGGRRRRQPAQRSPAG